MANKTSAWWRAHQPTKRHLIQLYAALLYNAHAKGFIKGEIYTGPLKNLCVPGLNCYSCPGAVGACPLGALQNALAASGNRAPWYAMGIVMLFGLMLGRTICGWLCPMGLIQELLHKLPTPKIKKNRITRALSYVKYAVLAVFVLALPLLFAANGQTLPAFCKYICPAGTLEGAVGLLAHPENADKLSMLGLLFTRKAVLLVLIMMACVFVYRAFCRFLCPLGAIYGLFSRFALTGMRVEADKCTRCGRCVAHCKMDIRKIGDRECIACGACVQACPTQAISLKCGRVQCLPAPTKNKAKRRLYRVLACLLALAVLAGVGYAVNRQQDAPAVIGAEVGMQCPDFSVPYYDTAGSSFSPQQSRGRVTVINFWATWCAPCVAEMPYFEKLLACYPEDIALVGIHSNMVTEDVRAFLSQRGWQMPFAIDMDGSAMQALGVSNMLPVTVVLDRQGRIVYNQTGSVTFELLESLIAPLL